MKHRITKRSLEILLHDVNFKLKRLGIFNVDLDKNAQGYRVSWSPNGNYIGPRGTVRDVALVLEGMDNALHAVLDQGGL